MPECTPGRLPAAVLMLAFSLLTACSSTPSQPESTNSWGFSGKVGLWAYGKQESANVEWQDCDNSYLVRLSGPLGVGGALVYGNDSGVSLHRGNDAPLYADSPEALLASMGWYLPVSFLRYWLQGLPSPDSPYQREPQSGDAVASLSQSGWRLAYSYQGGQIARINMEDDNIRLKWIIRHWHESAVCTAP